MIPLLGAHPPVGGGGGHDSDITAWFTQVGIDGGTVVSATRTALDTFAAGCKSDGVWSLLDYWGFLAADDTFGALRDLVARRQAVNHSSAFTAANGFKGNGSSQWVDSGFDPSTMGVNFLQNSASIFVFNRTTTSSQNVAFGSEFSTNGQGLIPPRAADGGFYQVNTGVAVGIAVQASNGFWHCNRSSSTATQLYKNGTNIHSDTDTSNAIPSAKFAIGADFSAGAATLFCSDQIAIVGAGGSFTSTQAAALAARVATLATAIGF